MDLDELGPAARNEMKKRDFATGKRMFTAAACLACHHFGNAGGMNGPDLTGAGGRFSAYDLIDHFSIQARRSVINSLQSSSPWRTTIRSVALWSTSMAIRSH